MEELRIITLLCHSQGRNLPLLEAKHSVRGRWHVSSRLRPGSRVFLSEERSRPSTASSPSRTGTRSPTTAGPFGTRLARASRGPSSILPTGCLSPTCSRRCARGWACRYGCRRDATVVTHRTATAPGAAHASAVVLQLYDATERQRGPKRNL